ncbi:flagellar biosynthesis protein FliO [Desulfosporosinus sp. HMP52]|uniref:FliO/MopB family protein n=1 Tax=Desulfosporosinus sp. HMP52 TaxID=1487923 RepID=UPI00051F985D|nr:flagellar biosynthetic protein FliO [Desulfosporosinus sp. HMP52]KGK90363.1 flagellar biosynthesis protein FliO [Desulfosporosinus sp. HMP52]
MFNEGLPFPSNETAPVVTQSVFSWWGLLGTLMVFLIILFVSLWILRRLNKANLRTMSAPWARVLDRQMLSGQQSLYLVEIAGQLQVLGGSDHHLVKISEINDPQVAAEILEEIATRPTERVEGWFQTVHSLWKRRSRSKEPFSDELERLLEEVEK